MTFKREQDSYGYTSGLAAAYTTGAIEAGSFSKLSLHCRAITSSADGYLYVEGSNYPSWGWSIIPFVDEDGDIQDGYHILTTSVNTNHMFDASDVGVGWIRLRWAVTEGSGELSWFVHRKR